MNQNKNNCFLPLPYETQNAYGQYKLQRGSGNLGLLFDRYLKYEENIEETKVMKKETFVAMLRKGAIDDKLLKAVQQRWEATVPATALRGVFQTDWRLVPGLGQKGGLEVGFSFDRYGFPLLPGSGLKGLARAAARHLLFEEKLKADAELGKNIAQDTRQAQEFWRSLDADKSILAVFGSQERAGAVVFWDAIPASSFTLEVDIMNPHYPKYYGEQRYPTDSQSPIPLMFLTVAPHTKFNFAVGWRGQPETPMYDGKTALDLAWMWLEYGLTMLGAGAKTSAGYGYFEVVAAVPSPQSAAIAAVVDSAVVVPAPEMVNLIKGVARIKKERDRSVLRDVETNEIIAKLKKEDWNKYGVHNIPADKAQCEYTATRDADGYTLRSLQVKR
jgi:CRISPR-associated protein Cmr6